MKRSPIPFKTVMVRNLLADRKTQTRRMNVLPSIEPIEKFGTGEQAWHISNRHGGLVGVSDLDVRREAVEYCSVAVGDLLWVREHYRTDKAFDDKKPSELSEETPLWYVADDDVPMIAGRFRHGRYMPRWASRLTLNVTEVRVQRLQEISEEDAKAEGFERQFRVVVDRPDGGPDYRIPDSYRGGAANWFADKSNGAVWDRNPWTCAITFELIRANIDARIE